MEEESLASIISTNPEMALLILSKLDYKSIGPMCLLNKEIKRQCESSPLKEIIEEKRNQSTIAVIAAYDEEEDTDGNTIYDFNLWLPRVGVSEIALTFKIKSDDVQNMLNSLLSKTRFPGMAIETLSERYELQGFLIEYFPPANEVSIVDAGIFGDISLTLDAGVFKDILSIVEEIHQQKLSNAGKVYLFQNGETHFVPEMI